MQPHAAFLDSSQRPRPLSSIEQVIAHRLAKAGITLNGPHPWDPQIRRSRALSRIMLHGTMGAGDAYVDGDWDCQALDTLTARLAEADIDHELSAWSISMRVQAAAARFMDAQSRTRARANVVAHYDIGNDLYAAMLGHSMAYSCGYWRDAHSLDAAQQGKFALICHKLGLRPGMTVLDVGCGWGGLAQYAAECHGVSVVGITLSPAQAAYARERGAGLPVEIREQDYREVRGPFDRIVSVGMFEHVGPSNYETFFGVMARALAPDGLFLLHTIGSNRSSHISDPWIARHIFPGSVLPSAAQISRASEHHFVLEDWHNFGADYDRTLMAWHARVEEAWPALSQRYDETFRRKWRYYLLTCAGTFRARRNQLWQLVLSPHGVRGGYRRVA